MLNDLQSISYSFRSKSFAVESNFQQYNNRPRKGPNQQ